MPAELEMVESPRLLPTTKQKSLGRRLSAKASDLGQAVEHIAEIGARGAVNQAVRLEYAVGQGLHTAAHFEHVVVESLWSALRSARKPPLPSPVNLDAVRNTSNKHPVPCHPLHPVPIRSRSINLNPIPS